MIRIRGPAQHTSADPGSQTLAASTLKILNIYFNGYVSLFKVKELGSSLKDVLPRFPCVF